MPILVFLVLSVLDLGPMYAKDRRQTASSFNARLLGAGHNNDCGCPLLYWLNCTKFGQLILGKIIKIIAIKCQILRPKCTKFDFGWVPPQAPLGSLRRSPDTLAGFKGMCFY